MPVSGDLGVEVLLLVFSSLEHLYYVFMMYFVINEFYRQNLEWFYRVGKVNRLDPV